MKIEDLQRETLNRLLTIEKREKYLPNQSIEDTLKRSYNVSRTFKDYKCKFPNLTDFLADGLKILEIGAGEGIALNEIIERYKVQAVGTNINGDQHGKIVKALAHNLPFDDNSFDVVLGIHSITWEPNQKKAIEEVFRVLKPGGKAFIDLFKFSEISTFWFGEKFWLKFSKIEFQKEYEFNPNAYGTDNYEIREESLPEEMKPISNNYFVTVTK